MENSYGFTLPDHYGKDLTALAVSGKLDPVVGREIEIDKLIQILKL